MKAYTMFVKISRRIWLLVSALKYISCFLCEFLFVVDKTGVSRQKRVQDNRNNRNKTKFLK